MKTRFSHEIKAFLPWLIAGMCYLLILLLTPFRVPCLFHLYTGLSCPGCGATRMVLALLRGDIHTAWQENPMLLIVTPVFAFYLFWKEAQYIHTGIRRTSGWEHEFLGALIVSLVLFGIYRNF